MFEGKGDFSMHTGSTCGVTCWVLSAAEFTALAAQPASRMQTADANIVLICAFNPGVFTRVL